MEVFSFLPFFLSVLFPVLFKSSLNFLFFPNRLGNPHLLGTNHPLRLGVTLIRTEKLLHDLNPPLLVCFLRRNDLLGTNLLGLVVSKDPGGIVLVSEELFIAVVKVLENSVQSLLFQLSFHQSLAEVDTLLLSLVLNNLPVRGEFLSILRFGPLLVFFLFLLLLFPDSVFQESVLDFCFFYLSFEVSHFFPRNFLGLGNQEFQLLQSSYFLQGRFRLFDCLCIFLKFRI